MQLTKKNQLPNNIAVFSYSALNAVTVSHNKDLEKIGLVIQNCFFPEKITGLTNKTPVLMTFFQIFKSTTYCHDTLSKNPSLH